MTNKELCKECYNYYDDIVNDDTIEECPNCNKMICYYCLDDHEMKHFDIDTYLNNLTYNNGA